MDQVSLVQTRIALGCARFGQACSSLHMLPPSDYSGYIAARCAQRGDVLGDL